MTQFITTLMLNVTENSNNPPQVSASKKKLDATTCDLDNFDYELKKITESRGYH